MEPASPALAGRFVSTAAREVQSIEADQRPEQKFGQAFTGALGRSQGAERTSNKFPYLLPEEGELAPSMG